MNVNQLVFLILVLLTIPVSISAITTLIQPGGEIFLGEEGLDIRAAVPPPYDSIAYFPPGSSPGRDMPLDVRNVDSQFFSASPSLYLDRIGSWYQWDSRRGTPGTIAFTMREPRVSVRIVQKASMEDVSSGTVSQGTALLIQLDTNLGPVTQRPGYNQAVDGVLDLLITTPGGGVMTGVETYGAGLVSLSRITPQGSLQTVPALNTGGWDTGAKGARGNSLYSAGTYIVQPRLSFNRVDENLRSSGHGVYLHEATVTLGSDRARITTRGDQIIRGNAFTVTISGSQGSSVYLWVDAGSKSGMQGDQPPMILFAQEGVSQDDPNGPNLIGSYQPSSEGGRSIRELVPGIPYGGVKYYALVTPDRDGRRIVEFRTSSQTDDAQYRLKIESPSGTGQPLTDEVQITVAKGSVSLVSGKGTYAIGEEVKLSGHNSESCDTYLFITGPNLPSNGARLDQPRQAVRSGDPSSFTVASGDCETWEYRLYTGDLGIDAGTYTIYAVPGPIDRYNLGSVPYQTIPLTLRRPYVTLQNQETTVASGDSLILTGRSSSTSGSGVAIWIFGKNFFVYDLATVERDGAFEYELSGPQTAGMVAGQYAVIIQHPMGNGEFDVWLDGQRQLVLGRYPYSGAPVFRVGGPGALMGPEAANALISALNSQFIDDTYTRYDIHVTSPKITINSTSLSQDAGRPVIIEGTTNLAAGKRLLIEISDNRFTPTRKSDPGSAYGFSGTAEIWQGDGDRFFSLTVPAGKLVPGEYRIFVQAVESEATTSDLLTITIPKPVEPIPIVPLVQVTVNETRLQDLNGTSNI
ncbi:MAG: DUF3821 domain-containing protein, partial [Methanobacteriota archaeon]